MFLPTTQSEIKQLGWSQPDIILITGDSYVDSPFFGISVIGKFLAKNGFKVAIIAQPDINSEADITRLGEPKLFWGITAGCLDSMVANYTATNKKRKSDDLTPGGVNNRRPDRATIAYCNLIRRHFKNTKPLVIGGIEASLRRVTHYDFWSNRIRKSILFNAKADILLYGMAEKTILNLANALKTEKPYKHLKSLCYISKEAPDNDYLELPSFEAVKSDKKQFISMFHTFYENSSPQNAKGLYQLQDTRYLIQNPPAPYMTTEELDAIHELNFERRQHPFYAKQGKVKALDTIKFSIQSHRGCYGECNFCAIAIHQGRTVRWRSEANIKAEALKLTEDPDFKGYISDIGGPTANMYGFECSKKQMQGPCKNKRCLYPNTCKSLNINHAKQTQLLKHISTLSGVKKVFVTSGIRYDLIEADKNCGNNFLRAIVANHISGQMKIAPEHSEDNILNLMGKPGKKSLINFKNQFYKLNKQAGKKQFLTYYFIAAHPGCTENDMKKLKQFIKKELRLNPEQIQIFTPTPSTYSSVMYYTETNPFNGKKIFVEKDLGKKQKQKMVLIK